VNDFTYTDTDGDHLRIIPTNSRPGLVIETSVDGCLIDIDDIERIITALRETAHASRQNFQSSHEGIATAGTGAPLPQQY
jgi:hypothetical protein